MSKLTHNPKGSKSSAILLPAGAGRESRAQAWLCERGTAQGSRPRKAKANLGKPCPPGALPAQGLLCCSRQRPIQPPRPGSREGAAAPD